MAAEPLEPYRLRELTDIDLTEVPINGSSSWFYRVEELGLVIGVLPPGAWDQLGGTPWFATQGLWGDAERSPEYLVKGRSYHAAEARKQLIEWFNENRTTFRVRAA